MSNPITGWIDVADQWGTQVSDMSIRINYSLLAPWLYIPGGLTEMVMWPVMMLATIGMWLMSLMQDQGFFVDVLGGAYQAVLDAVYQVINPWWIVLFALPVLFFRIFIGEAQQETVKDKQNPQVKHTRLTFKANTATLTEDASFRKKVITQLGQTAMIVAVIGLLMSNPFLIIGMAFGLLTSFASSMISAVGGGTGTATTTVVDGMLVPALQMVNFGQVLDPECSELWSRQLAAGGNVLELSCIPGGKDSADASWTMLGTAVGLGLAILCLVYFTAVTFYKLTFFEAKMVGYIALLPWRLAWMIASPGTDRQRIDEGWRTFRDALVALLWAMGLFAIMLIVPGLGTAIANQVATSVDTDYVLVPAMLVLGAVYAAAGYAVHKWYGHTVKWDSGKKRLVVVHDSQVLTSWGDFYQNKVKPVFAEDKPKPKPGAAAGTGEAAAKPTAAAATPPTAEDNEQQGTGMNAAETAVVDQASDGLDTTKTRDPNLPKLPVLIQSPKALSAARDHRPAVGAAPPVTAASALAAPDHQRDPSKIDGRSGPGRHRGEEESPSEPPGAAAAAGATGTAAVVMFSTAESLRQYLDHTHTSSADVHHLDASTSTVIYNSTQHEVIEGEVVSVDHHEPAAPPVVPLDPAEAYRQQVAALIKDLTQTRAEPPSADQAPTSSTGPGFGDSDAVIDATAAAALARTADGFARAAESPQRGPNLRDAGGVGAAMTPEQPFFAPEAMHNRWAELKRLADILGVDLAAVVINDEDARNWVTVEPDLNGNPQVRFGNPYGFGDDI